MNTPRCLRTLLVRGVLFAALSTTSALAISKEDLAALRAKAESGNGIAQYNLGLLYATQGDPLADPIEAYVWFNLAADNGATGRALVLLSSQMNTEQVAEAKQRLEARRQELQERKKHPSPVSASASPISPAAPDVTPVAADTGSPIVAAPVLPDPPISAAPLSERDFAAQQAELKKMTAELSAAWKENEQLKATIAKGGQASAATEQLQRERDQLRTTLETTNAELAKLRAQAANFEGERNALQQKISAAAQSQKDSLGAELAAATTKLHTVEGLLAQATAASGELTNAKQQIATLGEQVQKFTAENQRLSGLSAQANASAESKAAAEKEAAHLRAELSALQAQLASATTTAAASGTAQKQLEETQVKLEAALRSFELQQKEVERLQKALANIDAEREGLQKQLAAVKAAPPKVDPATEQRINQLTTDLAAARAASGGQVSQLQKQLSDTEAKLTSADTELARARQDREEVSKQLAAAKAAPVAPPAEITRLNSELTDARDRLAAAEHALARTKEEREHATQAATSAAQQQIAQLTSELQQLRQKSTESAEALAAANRERDSLRQQLSAAAAAPSSAANDLAALQARLKSSEEALSAANAERAALAERVSAAESKLSSAVSVPNAPVPATGEDPAGLRKELTETQGKLTAALRTYQLQQDEVDRLQKALANIDTERAQLADRVHASDTQASQAQAQAAANQEAAAQLAAVREQFRQAQNQIASLAGENSQLKNRLALAGPPPGSAGTGGLGAPSRPTPALAPASSTAVVSSTRAAPTAPTRPTPPPAPRTHTVAEGDTLTKIARHYYGSSDRWPQILEANRNVIKDVNNLTLGTTLKIP